MTLLGEVIMDNLTVASNYALFAGTVSPPSFIIGSTYEYDSSLQSTNLTGVTGTQQNLNVSTVTLTANSLIYGTTGVLSNVSMTDGYRLKIGSATAGTISIFSVYEPQEVLNNSISYSKGAMWSYNSTSHMISLNGTTFLATVVWNSTIDVGGGGGGSTTTSTTSTGTTTTTSSQTFYTTSTSSIISTTSTTIASVAGSNVSVTATTIPVAGGEQAVLIGGWLDVSVLLMFILIFLAAVFVISAVIWVKDHR